MKRAGSSKGPAFFFRIKTNSSILGFADGGGIGAGEWCISINP